MQELGAEDQSDLDLDSGPRGRSVPFPQEQDRWGFREWGRGRQEFCGFRMSQLPMGEEKPPAEGVGFFHGFIAPSWKDTSKPA